MLEIAKALKCGWLDLGKVESFKTLVDGYNPPKEIKQKELDYYLDCLFKGWGYIPTDKEAVKTMMLEELNKEQLDKWEKQIEDNSIYKRMIKDAFWGMVAIKALGGTFKEVEPDFSFTDEAVPAL